MEFNNNYARIDLDILKDNLRAVREHVKTKVLMVVKADAYGHGAVPVAKCLEPECDFFGVAAMSEALELRSAGIQTPILMLGHTPVNAFPLAVKLGIRPAIFQYEDALALSREAQNQGVTSPFHFALDTGMSRIGFQATAEDADLCKKIADLPGLYAEGLFTHFATADDEDQTMTKQQVVLFDAFDAMLKERGLWIPLRHVENSAALTNFSAHYDMVRAGLVVYGMHPSQEVCKENVPVKPCLSWHSHVTLVKPLAPGRVISYGATCTVTRPSLVATVSAGYADGYRRHLSGKFHVLIRGCKAPILGRVCMDQFVVDVTDIPGVQAGDPVVLIGTQGENTVTADEMADAIGTISYEIVCGLSRRVPRQYIQKGQPVREIDQLLDNEKFL